MNIRPFRTEDEAFVIELWKQCGLVRPWNDPTKDIRRKGAVQPELFLVGVMDGSIIATVMAGYEGHRGWMNYLAVSPIHRCKGLARMIVAAAEDELRKLGCPKINLQVRNDNSEAIGFYQRMGYLEDAVVSLGKRLERDD
jgi:ribosomal protein S18 acetylase RimI-like enzyme